MSLRTAFSSLRWRLQIWHGLILLATIAALCGAVFKLATVDRYRHVDREIIDAERQLVRAVLQSLNRDEADNHTPLSPAAIVEAMRTGQVTMPPSVMERFSGTEPGYLYFIIRAPDGTLLLQSPNAPADRELLPPPTDRDFNEQLRSFDHFREARRTGREGFASLVGRDTSAEIEQRTHFAWSLAAAGLTTWVVGLLGGWWLAGRAIQPIASISRTATRIAEGNLDERIDSAGTANELDQLGHVLNSTFDRLHEAFERQRRFTADAAHELRTPVTVLLTETQRILRREQTPEVYQQSMHTCQDAAQRMRRLTEALLLLARQEAATAPATVMPCDLVARTTASLELHRPLATERHITLHSEFASATCFGDPDALDIVINNLVANAIQHHHETGGQVWVSTRSTADQVVLEVRDDGPGIPAEHLPHIFERFHRADQARSGGTPHTGLGLAIVHAIVANHHGTLKVQPNADGPGVTFTVRLPLEHRT